MPSSHLIPCGPLLLLPPIPPSIRVFSNESIFHMRWPKYWSFSFSISPSNEHPGLISFRMGWLDFHAVQGTLKSLLQHHCSKASILRCSAFFTVQLSHPYLTTGKTRALHSFREREIGVSLLLSSDFCPVRSLMPASGQPLPTVRDSSLMDITLGWDGGADFPLPDKDSAGPFHLPCSLKFCIPTVRGRLQISSEHLVLDPDVISSQKQKCSDLGKITSDA